MPHERKSSNLETRRPVPSELTPCHGGAGVPDEMRDYLEQRERTLEARVKALEAALLPFVAIAGEVAKEAITSPTDATFGLLSVLYADLRRASAAYHDIPHDGTPDDPTKASF